MKENNYTSSFIFPNHLYGGHEVMTINILNYIASHNSFGIECHVNKRNDKVLNSLSALNEKFGYERIKIFSHSWSSDKNPLLSFFQPASFVRKLLFIKKLFALRRRAVLVQGSIELGAEFIWISYLLGCRNLLISYIPMCHTFKHMGFKLGELRDVVSALTYKMCMNYITISNPNEALLKKRNASAKVNIVNNFVAPLSNVIPVDGRSSETINLAIIGRVEIKQKGHDILINALKYIDDEIVNRVHLIIVGDGPDMSTLKDMIDNNHLSNKVSFTGWVDKWYKIDEKIDYVVMPSRFEGVPLTMLEALSLDIPCIGANRDGMSDYISDELLYDVGGSNDIESRNLAEKINYALSNNEMTKMKINRDDLFYPKGIEVLDETFL
ncbi:putative glycosyl transferase [Pectobacterium atrosepticum SCRI1043]|uniref:Glycosyl transferase n=1 Tax=Pectobacterium atrosepticum (strain SCRI 1043 / ATCC BAA-672) TaxID=218491 RepID=Q6D791_PECAS|nr:glycosyltransferase [Pectobacterium atrosepticum]MCL6317513.1 glycosyltransferase [Pectobacterium atrosepticum]MCL6321681.1 glycosyltransferase [Pectobacterium atrosepticum]CAG74344.1 putative glycosyl transferase [Pectobacterium atrosepticum SCRI1043]